MRSNVLLVAVTAGCATVRPPAATALGAAAPLPATASSDTGTSASTAPQSKGPPAFVQPTEAERRQLLAGLVEAARKYYVLAPRIDANLGRRWDDDLADLEQEFAGAESKAALTTAIEHFANSLHNPHSYFDPPRRPVPLTPGFVIDAEWRGSSARFFVSEVLDGAAATPVKVGDELISFDGVPAKELLHRARFESSVNSWRGIARGIAQRLSNPRTWTSAKVEGDTSVWVFAPPSGGKTYEVKATYAKRERPEQRASEHSVSYDTSSCIGYAPRDYGAYELRSSGVNFCLYASSVAPYRAFPIVRQVSFDYGSDTLVRADYHALRQALGALPSVRGVILDLRDNSGGNNTNWFVDWWAPRPYVDRFVRIRLIDGLGDEEQLGRVNTRFGEHRANYVRALAARAPGQEFTRDEPFFCQSASCDDDNRYVPMHRVTDAPVALLVGPGCVSSCDSFAALFDENDFAPLIGEPTAVGFTAFRYSYPVRTARGDDLGFVTFALSVEVSGKTKTDLEAVPLHLDYPVDRTFGNRSRYDRMLVDNALEAFKGFPFKREPRR
jgi:hypothetical protein